MHSSVFDMQNVSTVLLTNLDDYEAMEDRHPMVLCVYSTLAVTALHFHQFSEAEELIKISVGALFDKSSIEVLTRKRILE